MSGRLPQDLSSPVATVITLVAMAATALVAVTAGSTVAAFTERPLEALSFLALVLVLQLFSVPVYGRGSISVTPIALLAAGFALGIGVAACFAVVAALVQWARGRGRLYRAVFDASNFALAAGIGVAVHHVVLLAGGSAVVRIVAALAAGLAYTAVNIPLVSLVMALSERRGVGEVWRERFAWLTAHYLAFGLLALASMLAYERVGAAGLLAFGLPPALMVLSVRQYVERTRESVETVRQVNDRLREANAELETRNAELRELFERVRRTHLATIAALSRAMEAKDLYTGGHTERVAEVAVALARRMGIPEDDLHAVEVGALLHDIGKIGIPEQILNKSGPLSEDEWRVMREHPAISDYILAEAELPPIVRQIARWSHERIDGRGYPDGLAGDAIPLAARIVLVADAFDALTSDRSYRPARPAHAALAEIRASAGTQFCPEVVATLEHLYRDEPALLGAPPRPVSAVA